MGCWNETCMISRLPIRHGDEVVVVFLEGHGISDGGSGTCYATDLYTPLTIGVYGTYDDYGGADFKDNPLVEEYLKEVFKKYLVEKELGPNEYPDPAVKKDEISWNNLMEWTHEGRLELAPDKYFPDRNRAVGRVMILKRVWDAALKNKCIPEKFSYYEEILKVSTALFNKEVLPDKFEITLRTGSSEVLTSLSHWYTAFSPLDALLELTGKASEEELSSIGKRVVDIILVGYFVDITRTLWMPQCGKGSQSQEYECYEELMEVMKEIIAENIEEIS